MALSECCRFAPSKKDKSFSQSVVMVKCWWVYWRPQLPGTRQNVYPRYPIFETGYLWSAFCICIPKYEISFLNRTTRKFKIQHDWSPFKNLNNIEILHTVRLRYFRCNKISKADLCVCLVSFLSPASRRKEGGLLNSPSSVRPSVNLKYIQLIVQSSILCLSRKKKTPLYYQGGEL